MKQICAYCNRIISPGYEDDEHVSHGICNSCFNHAKAALGIDLNEYIDMLEEPVLLVDSDMHILAANSKSVHITGKNVENIINHIGGEVFECENSVLQEGCGKTDHCSACTIRNSVSATFKTGNPINNRYAILFKLRDGVSSQIEMLISTKRDGDVVFLQIEPLN